MVSPSTERIDALEGRLTRTQKAFSRLWARRHKSANGHHASRRVSPKGFPYLARGKPITFVSDGESDIFLASGWLPQEDWGVWGKGDQHLLRFSLDDTYRGGYIQVKLTLLNLALPDMDKPELRIVANGHFIQTMLLSGRKRSYGFRLPPACLGDGNILLALIPSQLLSGAMVANNGDERMLGIGLIQMEIQ